MIKEERVSSCFQALLISQANCCIIQAKNQPLPLTGDPFSKRMVRHDLRKRRYDDKGILNIGIIDFLLDDSAV